MFNYDLVTHTQMIQLIVNYVDSLFIFLVICIFRFANITCNFLIVQQSINTINHNHLLHVMQIKLQTFIEM